MPETVGAVVEQTEAGLFTELEELLKEPAPLIPPPPPVFGPEAALDRLDLIGRQEAVNTAMDRMGAIARRSVLEGRNPEDALKQIEGAFFVETSPGRFETEPMWDVTGQPAARAVLGWAGKAFEKDREVFALAGDYARGDQTDPQRVLSLPRDKREKFFRFLFEQTVARERGTVGGVGASLIRGAEGAINNLEGFFGEFTRLGEDPELRAEFEKLDKEFRADVYVSPTDLPGVKERKARRFRLKERLEQSRKEVTEAGWTRRQIKELREAADPVTGRNWIEQGLFDVAGMLPNLLASTAAGAVGGPAGAIASAAWWVPQIATETLDDFRRDGLEINEVTKAVAIIGAIPEAAVEVIQIKGLSAGLRRGLGTAVKGSVRKFAKDWAKQGAKQWTREVAEEFIQGLNRIATKTAANYLTENAPGVDFAKELEQLGMEMRRAAVSLGILLFPGEVVGGLRHVRAVRGMEAAEAKQAKVLDDMFRVVLDPDIKQSDKNLIQRNINKVIAGEELAPKLEQRITDIANKAEEFEALKDVVPEVPSPPAEVKVPAPVEVPPPREAPPVTPAPPPIPAERRAEAPKIVPAKVEVKPEVPAIPTEPVSAQQVVLRPEIAEEAAELAPQNVTADQVLTEEDIKIRGKEMGVRIFESGERGKRGGASEIGSSYIIRQKDFDADIPLEDLIAAQLAEPEQGIRKGRRAGPGQSIADLIEFMKGLEQDAGRAFTERVLTRFAQMAPVAARTRKKLFNALDFQPEVGREAGGLSAEVVGAEYARLRKVLTPGLAKEIMKDRVFWQEGTPINVTPEKLAAYAQRARVKPRRAFFMGQFSMQMTNKQLVDFVKDRLPDREYKLIAAALEKVAKSRTPGERVKVLEAVGKMIERHEKASAILDLKEVVKKASKENLGPELKVKLDQLLEGVAISKPQPATVRKALSLMAAAEKDAVGVIPQKAIMKAREVLGRVGRKSVLEMTAADLRFLEQGVKAIMAQNKAREHLLWSRSVKTAQEQIGESTEDVARRHSPKFLDKEGVRTARRATSVIRQLAILSQMSYDTMVNMLAGDQGTAYRILFKGLKRGQDVTIEGTQAAQDFMHAKLEQMKVSEKDLRGFSDIFGGERSTDTVHIDLPSGPRLSLTRAQRIELFLHLQDASTRAEILKNKSAGIRLENETRTIRLTGPDIAAIRDSLSSDEKGLAGAMSAYVNGPLKAALNTAWEDEFGFEVARTPDYWRRRRDRDATEPNDIMRQWQDRLLQHQGLFKERTGTVKAVIVGDAFRSFFEIVNRTNNFVGKGRSVNDALRVLKSEDFRSAVKAGVRDGDFFLRQMESTIKDFAGMEIQEREALGTFATKLIRRAQVGVLGLKPHIVAYQTVSLLSAMNEIDPKFIASSKLLKFTNKDTRAEIFDWSPRLRARIQGSGHQILTPGAGTAGVQEFFGRRENIVQRLAMKPILAADTQVMYRIWRAAKVEGQSKGIDGDELMRFTSDRANEIVDRTQPTWDVLTISQIQRFARKNPLAKLFVLFSSQRNKNLNMVMRAMSNFAASKNKLAAFPAFARKVAVPTIINAMLIYFIKFGWDRLTRKKPPEPEEAILGVLDRLLGNWLIFGDVASTVLRTGEAAAKGKPPWFVDTKDNVLESGFRDVLLALYYVILGITQAADDQRFKSGPKRSLKKAPDSFWRAGESATRATGTLTGVPASGPLTILKKIRQEVQK